MPSRGVLYIVYGTRIRPTLERSLASLRETNPHLGIQVEEVPDDDPNDEFRGHLRKAHALDLSPFDETLFLDADTVVMAPLDFGFDMAARHGLACCHNESPWAVKYESAGNHWSTPEYNTGVFFFTAAARPILERWRHLAGVIDSGHDVYYNKQLMRQHFSDQASFARAVEECDVRPFVLPCTWNLRPRWVRHFHGPVRVWHEYSEPPEDLKALQQAYGTTDRAYGYHILEGRGPTGRQTPGGPEMGWVLYQ